MTLSEEEAALLEMVGAAAVWIEALASRHDTETAAARIESARVRFRRAERKRRRNEKRASIPDRIPSSNPPSVSGDA